MYISNDTSYIGLSCHLKSVTYCHQSLAALCIFTIVYSDKKLKKEEKRREEIEDEVRVKKREQGTLNRELASLENKYQLLVSYLLLFIH